MAGNDPSRTFHLASSKPVPADLNEPVVVDGLAALDLPAPQDATVAAVYDQPIGIRLLFEDPTSGEEHYLVRYPQGVRGRAHRHTAAHHGRPRRPARHRQPGRRPRVLRPLPG